MKDDQESGNCFDSNVWETEKNEKKKEKLQQTVSAQNIVECSRVFKKRSAKNPLMFTVDLGNTETWLTERDTADIINVIRSGRSSNRSAGWKSRSTSANCIEIGF